MARPKKTAKYHPKTVGRSKLLTHQHSGRLRHHRHTSYGSLALVLLFALAPLFVVSQTVAAADSYQTFAVVPGPAPKSAPVITNLSNGRVFTSADPVPVQGTCPSDSLVKIYKNGVMGGSSLCQNGHFSLSIDLFPGSNNVIARAYNANDKQGPDSTPITVNLQIPGVSLQGTDQLGASTVPANQFYVTSEIYYRGADVGDKVSWPLALSGGEAPFAVSVGWGDGKSDLFSRGAAGVFNVEHVFNQAAGVKGGYAVVVKATDAAGHKSYLQFVAIVSGNSKPAGVLGSIKQGYNWSFALRLAWQLLLLAAVLVFGFWIGEKREVRLLRRQGRLA